MFAILYNVQTFYLVNYSKIVQVDTTTSTSTITIAITT